MAHCKLYHYQLCYCLLRLSETARECQGQVVRAADERTSAGAVVQRKDFPSIYGVIYIYIYRERERYV